MRGQVTEVFKIYDSRDKQLIIPVYQRNYDWKARHCAQLLSDLVDLAKTDRKHFFGAVVGRPEGSWHWVVIDGQQRLTTVSLLMLALANLASSGAMESSDSGLGMRIKRNYLLTDVDTQETTFRLKPVKDDSDAYQRLFGSESEYIESSNVTANYRYFLNELPGTGLSAEELWDAICRLEVMHLDLEPDDDPQRIFESLNSTGLALSEADKVRNLVLMGLLAKEQNRVYEDYWNRIEKNVDFETDTFLRWYLVTKTSKTPRINQVYDVFKSFAEDSGLGSEKLLEEVREYSDHYRRLRTAATGAKAVDARLRRLNLLKQDVVLPLFMPLLAEYRAGTITERDLAASIRIVESYLFRRFICELPTNALNKVFATLYKDVRKLRTSSATFAEVLAYSLERRTGSGLFPNDEQFRDDFATRNLYKVQADRRRYIFECLENLDSNDTRDISNALERGDLSVEHIMPQTLNDGWKEHLGFESESIHQTWVHRIGNLTITGYNSVYSNSSFQNKKNMESGFSVSPYRLNAGVKSADSWGVEELTLRSNLLTNDAVGYWEYPEITFVPPAVQLPVEPMGTDTDFTNRAIAAFEFEDTKATVRSWQDFLVQVLQLLVLMDRDKVFSFARSSDWFQEEEKPTLESFGVREIVPGLHVISRTSTSAKVALLRRVFTHLRLDPDDIVLTIRKGEGSVEKVEDELDESPYTVLTKFIALLTPLAGLNSSLEDTVEIRNEIRIAIDSFAIRDFKSILGQTPVAFVSNEEKMKGATPEQIVALCAAKSFAEEQLDPFALHSAIVDGTLVAWLDLLEGSALLANG